MEDNIEFDANKFYAEEQATKKETSVLMDILIGLVVLNTASALIAAIWIYISIRLAVFVVIFGGFGLFAGMISWRPNLASLFLFFFILGGYEAIVLEEYITATLGGAVDNMKVADAPAHEGKSLFYFEDGNIRPALTGKSSVTSKAGDSRAGASFSYVVPYVDKHWNPSMPVQVWAVCSITKAGPTGTLHSSASECGDFNVKTKTAVAVPESGFFRAIDNAVDRHKLKVAPNALIVEFVDDPAEYIYNKQKWVIWFPVVINAIFIVTVLVFWQKSRKEELSDQTAI